ncbi:MAG: hypothetical protein K0S80_2944 [Neobacillus sp.]|jgi:hypothetical protein|nr:hypothetical protein [Neobacillus sp.]
MIEEKNVGAVLSLAKFQADEKVKDATIEALRGQLKTIQEKYTALDQMKREQWQNKEIKELRHILKMQQDKPLKYGEQKIDSERLWMLEHNAYVRKSVLTIARTLIDDDMYSKTDAVNDLLSIAKEVNF